MMDGVKMYRCELSDSRKTLKVWRLDDNGLTSGRPDAVMRVGLDEARRYIDAVKAINSLRKVAEDGRDDAWLGSVAEANAEYNATVRYILNNCRGWR